MKKIIFSTIFIYLVIALALSNLPEIVNYFIVYSNERNSVAEYNPKELWHPSDLFLDIIFGQENNFIYRFVVNSL